MKKILFLIVCLIAICLIYSIKIDNKISILQITDSKIKNTNFIDTLNYNKRIDENIIYYNGYNYRIMDLFHDIEEDISIKYNNKSYSINNLFVKCDIIILNIGNTDMKNINDIDVNPYDYIDKIIFNYGKLLKLVRKESKENIIIFYDNIKRDKYQDYYYNKLKLLAHKYNILIYNEIDLDKYLKNV